MTKTMTEKLIGKTVKIDIKEPEGYTNDLYKSIQSAKGKIIKHQSDSFVYDDAWLIEFDMKTTHKYGRTDNGKWSGSNLFSSMQWWIESKDFIVLD